ncbi:MAG: hypothetical protein ACJ760_06245 [Thermoleophilaceae bacterium]
MGVRERGVVAAAGVAGLLAFLLAGGALTDDAYITLAYAKNLALHLHWGLIPQETANTATSPLTVAVLATASEITRIGHGIHPVRALGVLVVVAWMAAGWGWTRVVRALEVPWIAAAIGVAVTLADPFLLSAVGLEVVFVPALLVVLLAVALEGRAVAFGVVAGAMLLTRLDLLVFVIVLGVGSPGIRAAWRRVLVVAGALALPWFAASWLLLGSAIPDTLVIKVEQTGRFGSLDYLTGPIDYLNGVPWLVSWAFAPALLGLAGLAARLAPGRDRDRDRRLAPVVALGVAGVVYYGAYCVLSVPPYHWYYVTPIAALSTAAVVLSADWMRAATRGPRRSAVGAAPLAVLAVLAVVTAATDVAHGVPWRSPPIFGNAAIARDYARVGIALRPLVGDGTVEAPGEIGTLAYFCGCAILDEFSDRGRVVERVNRDLEHGPGFTRVALRLNYLWLDRDERPRRPRLKLVYSRGPGPGWRVWSPAYGRGHIELRRAGT